MNGEDMTRDEATRELLAGLAGSPRLANREDLLDALAARIDAGGEDVEDAPLPSPMLVAVPGTSSPARFVAKAASLGVAGWLTVVATAAAAATAGALLMVEPRGDAPPQIPPSTVVSSTPSVADTRVTPSAPPVSATPEGLELPGVSVSPPPLLGPNGVDPGPVVDTLAPVVSAVDASALLAGVVDLLGCSGTAPVVATASDGSGVTSAMVRLTVAGADLGRFPMTTADGERWSASVAPIAVASLGSLTGSVTVTVEAFDAAGNVGTHHTTVPLDALACLG